VNRVVALGIAAALAIGCASAHMSPVVPLACPESGLGSIGGRPPLDGFRGPVPRTFFMPPSPIPPDVRGHRVVAQLIVDSTGVPKRDSITVCGVPDSVYAQTLAQLLATMRFEPARRDGKIVGSPVQVGFDVR
jgi:hypothetical protein